MQSYFICFHASKGRLHIVFYSLNDTANQFIVAPVHHLCLQRCLWLNGVASRRVQGMSCSISSVCFCKIEDIYICHFFFFFLQKNGNWHYKIDGNILIFFSIWNFICLFVLSVCFYLNFQIIMLKNNVMRKSGMEMFTQMCLRVV